MSYETCTVPGKRITEKQRCGTQAEEGCRQIRKDGYGWTLFGQKNAEGGLNAAVDVDELEIEF